MITIFWWVFLWLTVYRYLSSIQQSEASDWCHCLLCWMWNNDIKLYCIDCTCVYRL